MSNLSNCRRCGTLIVSDGWSSVCPGCRNLETAEAGKAAGQFIVEHGLFAFLKIVLWCASVPLTFFGLIGLIGPWLSWVSAVIFFIFPIWGLFGRLGLILSLSFTFLSVCGLIVIDAKFNQGVFLTCFFKTFVH